MNFLQRQADPRHDLVDFTFVNTLHVFIVHAPVAGLAKKVLDVVRAPTRSPIRDGALRRAFSAGIVSASTPLTSMCI